MLYSTVGFLFIYDRNSENKIVFGLLTALVHYDSQKVIGLLLNIVIIIVHISLADNTTENRILKTFQKP